MWKPITVINGAKKSSPNVAKVWLWLRKGVGLLVTLEILIVINGQHEA